MQQAIAINNVIIPKTIKSNYLTLDEKHLESMIENYNKYELSIYFYLLCKGDYLTKQLEGNNRLYKVTTNDLFNAFNTKSTYLYKNLKSLSERADHNLEINLSRKNNVVKMPYKFIYQTNYIKFDKNILKRVFKLGVYATQLYLYLYVNIHKINTKYKNFDKSENNSIIITTKQLCNALNTKSNKTILNSLKALEDAELIYKESKKKTGHTIILITKTTDNIKLVAKNIEENEIMFEEPKPSIQNQQEENHEIIPELKEINTVNIDRLKEYGLRIKEYKRELNKLIDKFNINTENLLNHHKYKINIYDSKLRIYFMFLKTGIIIDKKEQFKTRLIVQYDGLCFDMDDYIKDVNKAYKEHQPEYIKDPERFKATFVSGFGKRRNKKKQSAYEIRVSKYIDWYISQKERLYKNIKTENDNINSTIIPEIPFTQEEKADYEVIGEFREKNPKKFKEIKSKLEEDLRKFKLNPSQDYITKMFINKIKEISNG